MEIVLDETILKKSVGDITDLCGERPPPSHGPKVYNSKKAREEKSKEFTHKNSVRLTPPVRNSGIV